MKRHFGEIGKMPGMRSALRNSHPNTRPRRSTASKSAKAAPAWAAPSTVREPSDTTSTSQNSAANGEKLLP